MTRLVWLLQERQTMPSLYFSGKLHRKFETITHYFYLDVKERKIMYRISYVRYFTSLYLSFLLQLKFETESNAVFLINLLNISEEAVIQVVTDKILESQIRTSLSEDSIANIVIYTDNTVKCSENLDPKIQALIQEVVPSGSGELVMVPILANERSGKLLYFTILFSLKL